jgi:flagellar biosynthesis/type III secretory pathway protein FliH
MRHPRPRREVVQGALALAQRLPERQQQQALASLVGLGHRYLSDEDLESVLEGLMSTSLGQRLIERGREQGLAQGREQGREQGLVQGREQGLREAIVRVLTRQFGVPPPSVTARLVQVRDPQRLDALLDSALAAASLEEFAQALG